MLLLEGVKGIDLKIAVVDPSLFTPFFDYEFCKALVECGHDVTIVGRPLRSHERTAFETVDFQEVFYRQAAGREHFSAPTPFDRIRKGLEHASGLKALTRLASERCFDIVHFQWLMLPVLDRLALAKLRTQCGLVLTIHNSDIAAHDSSSAVGRLGAAIQGLGQRRAVLAFDHYVVHSMRAHDRILALGVDSARILRMPHPPLPLEAQTSCARPFAAGHRHNVLFFGNIKPYKGVDVLIDAGITLASSRRDFLITIAGRPNQSMNELRAKVAAAGADEAFHFDLNYVSDTELATYLAAASLVAFPYRDIDGSGALSHAITLEKPIVASNVGGFSEPPFRDHIELVPPGNSAALAATIAGLLDDPARLQALADRSKALKRALPTWAEYARACLTVYKQIRASTPPS